MDAVNLAKLAREIAMDILPLPRVLILNQISDADWVLIQEDKRFQDMLSGMIKDWEATTNAKDRVRVKAQTGMEALMEVFLEDAMSKDIPLVQRVEVGKLMTKLGELEQQKLGGGSGQVLIQINFGEKEVKQEVKAVTPAIPVREKLATPAE